MPMTIRSRSAAAPSIRTTCAASTDRPSTISGMFFNFFKVTNILGTTPLNYSGFANVLVRDSNEPDTPGYLTWSTFGKPFRTSGGVFGLGGPFALQLGARISF